MAPVKRRRRLPTLVNRGLGLLEVILPRGGSESVASPLPEGRRDDSGFWYPTGYDQPGDIFTPQQRRLQAKQRAIQKTRRHPGTDSTTAPGGTDGIAAGATGDAGGSAGGGDSASRSGSTTAPGSGKNSSRDPAGAIPAAPRAVSGTGGAAAGTPALLATTPALLAAFPALLATTSGLLSTTSDLLSTTSDPPAIAAIETGDFGLREVVIPLPTARPESDAAVVARVRAVSTGSRTKTVAAAGGRRVDSLIPSE